MIEHINKGGMMKTVIILLVILIGSYFISLGIEEATNPPITITMDNPEMLRLALEYHGLNECIVDSEGVFYFVREGKWCSLYSIPFRKWYGKRSN